MDNLHGPEEKGVKEKCTIPSNCTNSSNVYAGHIVSGNDILQKSESEWSNLATQTTNAKRVNVIALPDQNIDDNDADDDDGDVILVPIEKGCENKRLRENVTQSLQNKFQNIHLSSTTPSKAIAAGSTEQTQSHSNVTTSSSSTNITNQNIFDNNQETETNQHNITYTNTITSDSREDNARKLYKCKDSGQNTEVVAARSDIVPSKDGTSSTSNAEAKLQQPTISQGGNVMSDHIDLEQASGKNCDIATESGNQSFKSLVSASVSNHSSSLDSATDVAADVTTANTLQRPCVASKLQSLESRPIYPNVPYSPYASPYGSPRSNRRRPPLRESRRISIEQSGSFLQLNQYKLMDQIGQGSYGLVKLAYSEEDSTHYAMKILSKRRLLRQAGLMRRGPKKSTSPLDRVYREIAVLKKLDHPNVVKLVEVLDDPLEDSLYMVFELVKQGEVLSIPTETPLSEERTWSVFRETLLGLEYLHYQRIIHGDLKPDNLLLTECGHVKIADLGVCNEFLGEDATMSNGSTAGTPAFRGPESLNLGQNLYCGKAADIWALGATLYSLVFGNVPFLANSIPILYEKIKNEPLSFPDNPKITDELRDCIQRMLTKDPAKRINLPQLKEHTWSTTGGKFPLPTEEENCRLVQVSDDDINSVVRSIPKLDTLILIKTMLKKHSFGNPFAKGISGRAPQRGGSRLERFVRAGRSNSAPGAYNMAIDRQHSADNVLILPSLSELGSSTNNEET